MEDPDFHKSVFINCPFDKEFEPILQAMLFCIVYLEFKPRIARERNNGAEVRIDKIIELIEKSKYSIHDLSRYKARKVGEIYRLNMPFELGVDQGCRKFKDGVWAEKKMLITADKQYHYQKALSDIAGNDIESHSNKFDIAIKKVRNWLVNEADAENVGAQRIIGKYADFQEWYFEKHRAAGATDRDIRQYPTKEFLGGMVDWKVAGEPASFD
ncbi:MAG: hypothetical protein E7773_11685 [Sphingomonas sp.]|uniref:hypothetical protein n=1 Tax=Sphingomonas sp. TaxID=28214 RepID=UPI00120541D1|nr:hypothetical protein [Sphingomonas sp.]THD35114.1 MAG: hypothetical protein E7773_11685 [Sphingomonas sp.]